MTKKVTIGNLTLGGTAPVRVESMLKIPLSSRDECLAQCVSLHREGCELIRAAYPSSAFKEDLEWLNSRSPVPLMADIHFDPALALEALEAGLPSLRINPGNMPLTKLRDLVRCAGERGAVIRIGANGGSLSSRHLLAAGGVRSDALVLAVEEQLHLLLDEGFDKIILSAKSTSVPETVRANYLLAARYPDFPFHIGITEAGFSLDGIVKSAAGLALLLSQGIGNSLRVSLTEPPEEEVKTGYSLLRALELRFRGPTVISCPTCGRKQVDVKALLILLEPVLKDLPDGMTVAVMGCEVNGPKEARDADMGVAGSPGGAVIFSRGQALREVVLEDLAEVFTALGREFSSAREMKDGKVMKGDEEQHGHES